MGRREQVKLIIEIFATFFKIGLFTFGGGYAMISIIEKDVVYNHNWLSREEFLDMLAIVQSVPGPISINSSLYVGYRMAGLPGAIAAVLGTSLPSFIIILLVALVFSDIQTNPVIVAIFKGMRPAVVALIAAPLVRMYKTAGITWKNIWMPIIATLLIWKVNLSPVYIIIAAAIIGIVWNLNNEKRQI